MPSSYKYASRVRNKYKIYREIHSLSLKISTLERQRSQAKCTYILSFRWLFTMLIHVHAFNHATLTIQATKKYLDKTESHKTSYRKLGRKRGVPGEVHMMMAPFPLCGRVELRWTHKGTQQHWPQAFFPTGRDSNSPETLVPAEPSPLLSSPRMKLWKDHEPQFDPLYI